MRTFVRRRPSASMVVALLALVVAAGGTAVAAGRLVNGDGLIRKHSLSGNRLRNHTITGRQINMRKLGIVPSAHMAEIAVQATNASALGGLTAAAFEPASHFVRSGIVTAPVGSSNTLATFGPFTLKLECTAASKTSYNAAISAVSTVANSDAFGQNLVLAGQAVDIVTVSSTPPKGQFAEGNVVADFLSPTGAAFVGDLTYGAGTYLGLVNTCYANALVIPSS